MKISEYKPHPKQLKFHVSNARICIFTHGNGAGGTYAGVHEVAMAATGEHVDNVRYSRGKYPVPSNGLVICEEYDTDEITEKLHYLLEQHLDGFPKSCSRLFEYAWRLKNGSYFEIKTYNELIADILPSIRLDWIWFNGIPRESLWSYIFPQMLEDKCRIFMTFTPIEKGEWIYREIIKNKEINKDVEVIKASIYNNYYLPPHYIDRMATFYKESDKDARLEGKYL